MTAPATAIRHLRAHRGGPHHRNLQRPGGHAARRRIFPRPAGPLRSRPSSRISTPSSRTARCWWRPASDTIRTSRPMSQAAGQEPAYHPLSRSRDLRPEEGLWPRARHQHEQGHPPERRERRQQRSHAPPAGRAHRPRRGSRRFGYPHRIRRLRRRHPDAHRRHHDARDRAAGRLCQADDGRRRRHGHAPPTPPTTLTTSRTPRSSMPTAS